jgi:hypothetical protein
LTLTFTAAIRVKAATTSASISEIVNDAVRRSLGEDADDLAAFAKRRGEPSVDFETFVRSLKRRGKL